MGESITGQGELGALPDSTQQDGNLPGAQETEPGAEAETVGVLPLFAEVTSL